MFKRLGILGGMGPAASAEFITRLIQQTPALCDQEHIPFVLWNEPRIPDRSTSMQNNDNLPLPLLENGILSLKRIGCDYIVIPCNSAHFWYTPLAKLGVPIGHIVDSIALELRNLNITKQKIGVLGTKGTLESGLYQNYLNKYKWDCIIPSKEDIETLIQPAINLIKANKVEESQELLLNAIHNLIDRNAQAIILGCTELPLAIKVCKEKGIPIVNSIDSLVKMTINNYKT